MNSCYTKMVRVWGSLLLKHYLAILTDKMVSFAILSTVRLTAVSRFTDEKDKAWSPKP
jgi:hypothetical protein